MDKTPRLMFKRGSLWSRLIRAKETGIATGALMPIATDSTFLDDAGIRFVVRILSGIKLKDEAKKIQSEEKSKGKSANPFLPFDKDLFVADISDTHVAVLNKYNVVDDHLLIITRHFEDQESLLTLADFQALWACMLEYNSLGFYNGGIEAGASQPHKHLQVIPLPIGPEGASIPFEPLFDKAIFGGDMGTVPSLPFRNLLVRINADAVSSTDELASLTFSLYAQMLRSLGMNQPATDRKVMQSGPYCFLVTRRWMFLVPRSKEFFDGISINSLGFVGGLLVRDHEQLDLLKKTGPMNALTSVAFPK